MIFSALAGIFLGLATATKPGVYTPLVLILGLLLIFIINTKVFKKIFSLIFYTSSVFGGYILAYFPVYFIRHPNPIPWLRLHEKSLKFYLTAGQVAETNYLNQWKGIFVRTYEAWWGGGKEMVLNDWSPVLPLGTIAAIIILVMATKKHKLEWIYISGLILVF